MSVGSSFLWTYVDQSGNGPQEKYSTATVTTGNQPVLSADLPFSVVLIVAVSFSTFLFLKIFIWVKETSFCCHGFLGISIVTGGLLSFL